MLTKMKQTKNINQTTVNVEVLDESEFVIICKHCGKQIDKVKLVGLSLICPLCGKPQNGQPHLKIKQ
jgi:Zn finger protein HypA/HybF involved in hydrogenase expression